MDCFNFLGETASPSGENAESGQAVRDRQMAWAGTLKLLARVAASARKTARRPTRCVVAGA